MKPESKIRLLHAAETFDSWRIVPRAFLAACFMWAVGVTHELLHWYMALPKEERSIEASGFASIVFLTVTGFLKLVYDKYASTSRDWNSQPIQLVTTTTTTAATGATP